MGELENEGISIRGLKSTHFIAQDYGSIASSRDPARQSFVYMGRAYGTSISYCAHHPGLHPGLRQYRAYGTLLFANIFAAMFGINFMIESEHFGRDYIWISPKALFICAF